MGNRRNGFTLVELLTAIVVMTIISGAAMMSLTAADQTAKREAERVQAYIYDLMRKADRAHVNFEIVVASDKLTVTWQNGTVDTLIPTEGCYFVNHTKQDKNYNYTSKGFSGGSIRVIGADGDTWYVILAVANEGRVRISDKAP